MTTSRIISFFVFTIYLKIFVLISFPRAFGEIINGDPYIQFEFNNYLPDARIQIIQDNKRKLPVLLNNNVFNSGCLKLFCADGYDVIESYSVINGFRIYKKFLLDRNIRV